jgi:hypothetical protein
VLTVLTVVSAALGPVRYCTLTATPVSRIRLMGRNGCSRRSDGATPTTERSVGESSCDVIQIMVMLTDRKSLTNPLLTGRIRLILVGHRYLYVKLRSLLNTYRSHLDRQAAIDLMSIEQGSN